MQRVRGGRQGGGRAERARTLSDEQRAELQTKLAALDAKFPPPARATVKDFVDHIDYAVKMIGIDHVGISSDFDGGGGVDGWNGADETFNVTLELVRRGYTEEQIGKIWSGNLLRVMDEVQKVAARSSVTARASLASFTRSARAARSAPDPEQHPEPARRNERRRRPARDDSGPAVTSVADAPMTFGASSDRS